MNNNGSHKTTGVSRIDEDLERHIDPLLETWLDQALAPDDAPEDLNGRVMVAVRGTLHETETAGRIGGRAWLLRIAAVVALAAIIGLAYMMSGGDAQPSGVDAPVVAHDDEALEQELDDIVDELDETFTDEFKALEDDLDQFVIGFDRTNDTIDDLLDSLNEELDS